MFHEIISGIKDETLKGVSSSVVFGNLSATTVSIDGIGVPIPRSDISFMKSFEYYHPGPDKFVTPEYKPGDRIVLLEVGNTYVVIGKVG